MHNRADKDKFFAREEIEKTAPKRIHDILNDWGWLRDYTKVGIKQMVCIAVTNTEVREIWSLAPNGTAIHIQPQLPVARGLAGLLDKFILKS
ncbi:MAG: hypothetical protein CSB47_10600 [Proteobacteria bacterium]|nr:MAG: hypothetical protein CSB47_10600 [Pseudomonadota bacterium]